MAAKALVTLKGMYTLSPAHVILISPGQMFLLRCFTLRMPVTLNPPAFQNEENKNMNAHITLILYVGLLVRTKADGAHATFNALHLEHNRSDRY